MLTQIVRKYSKIENHSNKRWFGANRPNLLLRVLTIQLKIFFNINFSTAISTILFAMLQLVDKRRLIALVLMEFVIFVTLSLKRWVVFPTTVHVRKLPRH